MESRDDDVDFGLWGNTTYSGYGSKQIFDLRARTVHAVSPNVSIFGNLGFQGDFAGQLSNRFVTATPDIILPPPDPSLPVIVDDPNLIGFGGRQYRLSGQLGVSVRTSRAERLRFPDGAQRTRKWRLKRQLQPFSGLSATIITQRSTSVDWQRPSIKDMIRRSSTVSSAGDWSPSVSDRVLRPFGWGPHRKQKCDDGGHRARSICISLSVCRSGDASPVGQVPR